MGAVHNQRSLVALDNLVDFIITCGRVSARLLPVPVWALQAGAALLGKGDAVQRLCGNLQVDISKARSLLRLAAAGVAGRGVAAGGGER